MKHNKNPYQRQYLEALHIIPEFIENVINGYTLGMSECEICEAYGVEYSLVVKILNIYTQYL